MDDELAFSALTQEGEKEFLSDLYPFTLRYVADGMCFLCVCVCLFSMLCVTPSF